MEEEALEQRLLIVQKLVDLEKERNKEVNKLRRKQKQTLSWYNLADLESIYIYVRDLHSRLISKIDDWTDLLDTDDQGDPIYPDPGMPESRYAPDSEDLTRKTSVIEEVLTSTRDVLITLMASLPPD